MRTTPLTREQRRDIERIANVTAKRYPINPKEIERVMVSFEYDLAKAALFADRAAVTRAQRNLSFEESFVSIIRNE